MADSQNSLSRRERQIMDVIYRHGSATVQDVREQIADAPSYSAVRALLRVLEDRGHLKHRHNGPRYVYHPTLARERARKSALKRLLSTFFDDSPEAAVAALLDMSTDDLDQDELDRLASMIERARQEGR